MLHLVDVGVQSIEPYAEPAGADVIDQLRRLAEPLRGRRILHLSATPYGGGVAEILRSEVPLLRDLGIDAEWRLVTGDNTFFSVTKKIHNALQGAEHGLTVEERETYLAYAARNAGLLEHTYDLVMVHDPQPLAVPALLNDNDTRWIWRCHIDTSEPNLETMEFLRPFFDPYHAAVFTLGGFVPPDFPIKTTEIIPPAIDPLSPKNLELPHHLAVRLLDWIGVEPDRPLIAQISRFDPWKDPMGVIDVYRLVREEMPEIQLAMVGSMASDDPEGFQIYHQIQEEARGDDGIHLFTNLTGVSNTEVNAFQRLAAVVIQKSIREGFGLVVSEALWKRTPVVAGRAGGIPLQLQDGKGGFLIETTQQCAQRTLQLLRDPELRRQLGESGRELVRERFLLPRLIADELRLYHAVLSGEHPPSERAAKAGLSGEMRDPVCGVQVDPATSRRLEFDGKMWYFCSGTCAREFASDPQRFARGAREE